MPTPLPVELITRKQSGKSHSRDEIHQLIDGFMSGEIPDYQMTAWLMAVYFRSMDKQETTYLTEAMIKSGAIVKHRNNAKPLGDKHSTGGVGDKITLILAPLVAAAGVQVPTISGRGLGFTGGTLDKLETIPGMHTDLSLNDFEDQVAEIGLAFGSQTEEIVPADKRIYALRDVTGTVRSLPLITASILSKKIAEGAEAMVFDVKCGNGAFMRTEEEAIELSEWLVQVADPFGLKCAAMITSMEEPLGEAVGNWIEVEESLLALKGEHVNNQIRELILGLAGTLVHLAGVADTPLDGEEIIRTVWDNGDGLEKFYAAVEAQGGDSSVLKNSLKVHKPGTSLEILAQSDGYVGAINAREIGFAAVALGAGRRKAEDSIDPAAGVKVHVKVGDEVKRGSHLATLQAKNEDVCGEVLSRVEAAFAIQKMRNDPQPLIKAVVTKNGISGWEEFRESGLRKDK